MIVSGRLRADFNGLAASGVSQSLGGNDTTGSLVKMLNSKSPLISIVLKYLPPNAKFYVPDYDAREARRIKGKQENNEFA